MDGNAGPRPSSGSGSVYSHDDDDSDDDRLFTLPPSKRSRMQATTPSSSNSSDRKGKIKHIKGVPDFRVIEITTCSSDTRGPEFGIIAVQSLRQGDDGQPIQKKIMMNFKPQYVELESIVPIPESVRSSDKLKAIEALLRRDLGKLQKSVEPAGMPVWCKTDINEIAEHDDIVEEYIKKDGTKCRDCLTYYSLLSRIIADGFEAKSGLSLGGSPGRNAMSSLLLLCKFVAEETLKDHGITDLRVMNVVGGATKYDGNCIIKKYTMRSCTTGDAIAYLSETQAWPDNCRHCAMKVSVPDVQCLYNVQGEQAEMTAIMAEVQSSPVKSMTRPKYGTQKKLVQDVGENETWTQALVGLKHANRTCSVLLEPEKGTIYYLTVEAVDGANYSLLKTGIKTWDFCQAHFMDQFDIEQFIGFFRTLVGILLDIPE